MEPAFWHQRWADNRIGFHEPDGNERLFRHWPELPIPADNTRVLVPLCGKSPDMAWLAARGHRVLGIELSEIAVADYFREQGQGAEREAAGALTRYAAGRVELLAGDFFDVDAATLASADAVYDRAALIALPPAMRAGYLQHLAAPLRAGTQGLLISIEYPEAEMPGPPFSIPEAAVHELLAPWFQVRNLSRTDVWAGSGLRKRGLTSLIETVYALRRL